MATKPTKIPRWADTGVIVEPSEAKKDSGWVAPELPPDTFFNWFQNLVGQWNTWLDERLFDDGAEENFQIKSPAGATDGGVLTLEGGDPGTVTGAGGAAALSGADGGATSGDGGGVNLNGGSSTSGSGGDASVISGDSAGTDVAGGSAILCGGDSTGDQGSTSTMRAAVAGAPGSSVRSKEDFFTADGLLDENRSLKKLVTDVSTPITGGEVIVARIKSTSSGDMADGFGPAVEHSIEDTAAIDNVIASTRAIRAGADDSGDYEIRTSESGTILTRLIAKSNGLIENLFGMKSDADSSNQNGVAVLGRGLSSGGSLGTAESASGAGVHGVGSEGATDGHGVVAQGSDTGTPTKTSLRIVPQSNEASSPSMGDLMVESAGGKLRVHDGDAFNRISGQVESDVAEVAINGNPVSVFPGVGYTIPANSLQVGDTIRIYGQAEMSGTGSPNATFAYDVDGDKLGGFVHASGNPSSALNYQTGLVMAIGVSGRIRWSGINIDPVNGSLLSTDNVTLDTTVDQNITVEGTMSVTGKSIQLMQFAVSIN